MPRRGRPGLCLAVAASPIHDPSYVDSMRRGLSSLLDGEGIPHEDRGVHASPESLAEALGECPGALVALATGGTERILVEALDLLGAGRPPIAVAGLPYANSLPALLEAAPLLRRARVAVGYLPGLRGPQASRAAGALARAVAAAGALRGYRLGVVGRPSPWLVYSRVDAGLLRERLGVELVEVPLGEVEEAYREARPDEGLLDRLARGAKAVERPRGELVRALRLYEALRRVVEERRLDGFTIECFEVIPRLGTTACLPLSLFNSQGVVAGCEADVPATVAMAVLHLASGRPVFMANPARIGPGEVTLAHCTAPISEGPYTLTSHFETGRGVGVSVEYPQGAAATVLRLSPTLDRLRAAVGVVVEAGMLSPLHCRTQVRLRVNWDPTLLLRDSMGNHHVMALGDHRMELLHFAELAGMEAEALPQPSL